MSDSKEFMTSTEVCQYCSFSTSVLNRLEKDGLLVPKRKLPTNNKRLYLKKDVDNFLKSIETK